MEEKLKIGEYWSKIKDMVDSTVQINHVSKFRVKVKNRNGKILDFDRTQFLELYEPKVK